VNFEQIDFNARIKIIKQELKDGTYFQ
jgi:hypothetical protein